MAKHRKPAGIRYGNGDDLCQALPPWIDRKGDMPPPRLLCVLPTNHKGKKHQNGQDHRWDVTGGRAKNRRGGRA